MCCIQLSCDDGSGGGGGGGGGGVIIIGRMKWLCDGIISLSVVFMIAIFYCSEIVWKLQQNVFLYW